MASEMSKSDRSASRSDGGVKRRGLLRIGTLITAFTGASAVSAIGATSAQADPIDAAALEAYVPLAEKGAASGVAALDLEAKVPFSQLPDFSATYGRLDSTPVNVKEYGAKGDGTTDDTAAIQAAFNAASNIIFPRNHTFRVSAPLKKTTGDLRINGRGATIKLVASFPAQSGENGVIDIRGPGADVYIAGLKIDGSADLLNGGAGFPDWANYIETILVQGASKVTIEGCTVTNFPSIGINVRHSTDVTIQHNTITNGMFHGIQSASNNRVLIFNNTVTGRGDQGVSPAKGGIGILGQLCNRIEITSNRISNTADTGSKTEGCNDVKYMHNLVEDSGKDGLKAGGHAQQRLIQRALFIGNTVRRINAWRNDGSMLIGGGDSVALSFVANILEGGGTRVDDAVRIGHMYMPSGTIDRVMVVSNICTSVGAALVRLNEKVGRIAIEGNEGDGYITSAGSTVASVVGNSIHNNDMLDTANIGIQMQGVSQRALIDRNVIADYKNAITVTSAGGATVGAIQISNNISARTNGDDCIRVDNFSGLAASINTVHISGNTITEPALGKICANGVRVGTTNLTIRAVAVTSNVVDNPNSTYAVTSTLGFTGKAGTIGVADVHGNVAHGNVTNKVQPSGQNVPLRFIGLQYRSVPNWGTWERGDTILNSFPSAGGASGWVCVASGTPGTWKAMPSLSA